MAARPARDGQRCPARPSVIRARHRAANAARSLMSWPLAAKSSANRRGYRRVVFLLPRHTTVHGSTSAIASRRTVSRETPSRTANCPAVRKSTASPATAGAGCGGAKAAATPRASASSNPAASEGHRTAWSPADHSRVLLPCSSGRSVSSRSQPSTIDTNIDVDRHQCQAQIRYPRSTGASSALTLGAWRAGRKRRKRQRTGQRSRRQ